MKKDFHRCWGCQALNDLDATRCRICYTILEPAAAGAPPVVEQATPRPAWPAGPAEYFPPPPPPPRRGPGPGAIVAIVLGSVIVVLGGLFAAVNLLGGSTNAKLERVEDSIGRSRSGADDEYADWVTFTDPGGRFQADFPNEPTQQDLPAIFGTTWMAGTFSGAVGISYTDLGGALPPHQVEVLLDSAVSAAAA